MLNSNYRPLITVKLPAPIRRQCYMHSFDLKKPTVPKGFDDYLPTVIQLCLAADAIDGMAHATFDEKLVKAGMSQRRPKPHVDGCFIPASMDWGHTGGGWAHGCNNIPIEDMARMPVIIAASAIGCKAWRGAFDGEPKNDGDLSHISHLLDEGEVLRAHTGYLLSPDCIHESLIMDEDTPRTFLRIALPNKFRPTF